MDATHILSSMARRTYSGQSERTRWDDLPRGKFASLDLTGYRDNDPVPMIEIVGAIEAKLKDMVQGGVSEDDAAMMYGFNIHA